MAAFMKLGDIKGEFAPSRQADRITTGLGEDDFTNAAGGDSFNCDDILLGHGATYRLKDVIITSFDNSDTLTNYNPGKGASLGAEQGEGWIIIESIVNQDNMQGLDAGGMNYAEAVGLDSSTVDAVNKLISSLQPANKFI